MECQQGIHCIYNNEVQVKVNKIKCTLDTFVQVQRKNQCKGNPGSPQARQKASVVEREDRRKVISHLKKASYDKHIT